MFFSGTISDYQCSSDYFLINVLFCDYCAKDLTGTDIKYVINLLIAAFASIRRYSQHFLPSVCFSFSLNKSIYPHCELSRHMCTSIKPAEVDGRGF